MSMTITQSKGGAFLIEDRAAEEIFTPAHTKATYLKKMLHKPAK